MSNKIFKILVIEDEEEVFNFIKEQLKGKCSRISIINARSKEEAISILKDKDNFFDLISLDLQIPITYGELDKDPSHGLSVLSEWQSYSKGTPIIILTGTSTTDMINDFLSLSNNLPIWFDSNNYSTVSHFPKRNLDNYINNVVAIYNSVTNLSEIEIDTTETSIPIEHDRLIRMFTKSQHCTRTVLNKIGGGLSDSKVYSLLIYNKTGSLSLQTIAKCGPNKDISLDAKNYDIFINRLNPEATPRKIKYIEHGAKDQAGVFYSLASNYSYSYFKASKEFKNNGTIRAFIKEMTKNWQQTKTNIRVTIKDIREKILSSPKAAIIFKEFNLDWAEEFESTPVQINSACYHGDLHGENILVDLEKNCTTLIDYGDINEGAVTIDPITLECSFLFHPNGIEDCVWPTIEHIKKWENIEDYIQDCPVAEEIHFCRTWAEEIKGSKRELAATLYSYALRQLKYPDTNKSIALELLNASRRIIDNS